MRRFYATVVFFMLWLGAFATAHSDSKTSSYIAQLKNNDDYRVRTQAALALGASGDDAAVQPLCGALSDSNVSVKVAAGAALGKLGKPAALPCLQAADAKETTPAVKAQIKKSIASIQAASAGAAPPPPPGPDAKFYVAIQITNKTSRSASEVDGIVRGAMQARLLAKPGYAVAPKSETTLQGGQIVKSKRLKGFFLLATVEAPSYDGGNLIQVVRVSLLTYPDKSLQGEIVKTLTQSNTPKVDTDSETALMKMCAENAIDGFQKVAASL